jgi:hypothetical protein
VAERDRDGAGFDDTGFDDTKFDEAGASYALFRQRRPDFNMALPVIVLFAVVAIVSGLVFGGVIQGDEIRTGLGETPTTQPTILIIPDDVP